MVSFEEQPPTQEFVNNLDAAIWQRLEAARPVEVFSSGDDVLLQLVEESDGKQFVTRSFSMHGKRDIEGCGRDFPDAWRAMQDIFEEAGIPIVRTEIAIDDPTEEQNFPIVMVSEYLPDNHPLIEATTQTKKELAGRLPGLFHASDELMLSSEVIREDMFKVVSDEKGEEQVVMIDADPLMKKATQLIADVLIARYIERICEFMWDGWCTPEERVAVITEFIKSTSLVVDSKLDDIGNPITKAFMNAHMMSQGINPRDLNHQVQ